MPPSVSIHVVPVLDPRGAFRTTPVKLEWLAAPARGREAGLRVNGAWGVDPASPNPSTSNAGLI
jgi:hypothetical protein